MPNMKPTREMLDVDILLGNDVLNHIIEDQIIPYLDSVGFKVVGDDDICFPQADVFALICIIPVL